MHTLTRFGKELRKYRIDNGITLGQMADDLEISPAYLSAIEMGKRKLPPELLEEILNNLKVSHDEKVTLRRLAEESQKSIRIDMSAVNGQSREVIAAFARNFSNLSSDEMEQIKNILEPHDEK